MKKQASILLVLTAYFWLIEIKAQTVMYNDGAAITILTSTNVYLDNVGFTNQTNGSNGTIDNDGSLYVDGHWTNNAGNNVFINSDATGTVLLDGTAAQNIGGSSATHFESLTVQNTGDKTLQITNNEVNQILTIDAVLDLNSYTLIIDNNASGAIVRSSDYIISENENSKISWNIRTATGTLTLPWGVSGSYIPLTFDITGAGTESGVGNIVFSTYATNTAATPNNRPLPTGVTHMTANDGSGENAAFVLDRWWSVTLNNYTANPTVDMTFTYRDSEHNTGTNTITEANLQVQRYNAGNNQWGQIMPFGTINTGANTLQVTGVQSQFSGPWVLVDNASPLPIELLEFKAVLANGVINLSWITASEINNDFFTVERSRNGIDFQEVLRKKGAGNSTVQLSYSDLDTDPYEGVSYYRLMQTDYDGTYTYSKMIAVNYQKTKLEDSPSSVFRIYPNPNDGDNIYLQVVGMESNQEILVILIDAVGRQVYSKVIITSSDGSVVTAIDPYQRLSPGIYTVVGASQNKLVYKDKLSITGFN